jgi:hypothetical protein
MKMQLFLVYRGRFSWHDVDTMPIYELLWYYNTLIEWKKEEMASLEQEDRSPVKDEKETADFFGDKIAENSVFSEE